ncbi:MAG TPA: DUF4124 domain-containing protein [Longimicrobiaceae bacterium]|nr:DUF4124 domain-containing protein [Longimicrobiaceae bacterium]
MQRIRLVVLLAVLAGTVAFVAPLKDGRPLLDYREVKGPFLRPAAGVVEGEGGVYKWQGEDGTWHYSNVPPEGREGVKKVKETITWAKGSGGSAAPAETDPERPRSAGELLAESKRLGEKTGARQTELQKLVDEANQ